MMDMETSMTLTLINSATQHVTSSFLVLGAELRSASQSVESQRTKVTSVGIKSNLCVCILKSSIFLSHNFHRRKKNLKIHVKTGFVFQIENVMIKINSAVILIQI